MTTLSDATTASRSSARAVSLPSSRIAMAVSLLVLAMLAGWGTVTFLGRAQPPTVPSHPAVEAKWGVRISSVNVTADGGLVDLRLVVLDPSKAAALMADAAVAPRLAVQDDGETTFLPAMTVHRRMAVGRTYFLLYRNTGGAIRGGHEISVLVGKMRIAGVVPG